MTRLTLRVRTIQWLCLLGAVLPIMAPHPAHAASFRAAPSMTTARFNGFTATLLQSGKVLVVGGSTSGGSSVRTNSVEIYDPASNTWSPGPDLITARGNHTATLLLNGSVLVAGGSSAGGPLKSAEIYVPGSDHWVAAATMANTHFEHTATLLNGGRVLVAGGFSGNTSAEIYDPVGDAWSPAASLTAGRFGHTATLLQTGNVLVTGGRAAALVATSELYDPIGNSWSPAGNLSALRTFHTATLLTNGTVLATGGQTLAGDAIGSAELYDPGSNTWSSAGAMSTPRGQHTATLFDDKVFVVGGFDGSASLDSAEFYDPSNNTWNGTARPHVARQDHSATLLQNSRVLIAGGETESVPPVVFNSAELFDGTDTPVLRCRAAIVAAGSALIQAEGKALGACAGKVVSGKLPHGTTCRTEVKTAAAIGKAKAKLASAVAKACGGKDKTCGAGNDDVPLADAGWQIGVCPNVEGGACTNAINDCDGIATCLTCIDEAAIDQATSLYYDTLVQTDPKAQKALNTCQATIGRAATTFLSAKSKALTKCWGTVNANKANGACPAADGKTAAVIAKAESKKVAAICKACGGTDKTCGGADDLTPAAIGFPSTCPAVDLPGAAPSCAGVVTSLQDLVNCVDCVTEFKVDCSTLAAVPGLATYPPECPTSLIPSRRRYKKNIEYLGAADLQRLHDDLLKFHLASYQYNTPGASPATHLGFIIDDVASSPSVAANGDTVDLYGYASMTVAAVQTQAREIDALKREIEALRAQIATTPRKGCGRRAVTATRRTP